MRDCDCICIRICACFEFMKLGNGWEKKINAWKTTLFIEWMDEIFIGLRCFMFSIYSFWKEAFSYLRNAYVLINSFDILNDSSNGPSHRYLWFQCKMVSRSVYDFLWFPKPWIHFFLSPKFHSQQMKIQFCTYMDEIGYQFLKMTVGGPKTWGKASGRAPQQASKNLCNWSRPERERGSSYRRRARSAPGHEACVSE